MSAMHVGKPTDREQAAQVWWVFLAIGILWLVFALLVFQVDATTVHGIAILAGVVCIAGGVMELFSATAVHGGWRVVRILLGIAFLVIGGIAFAHPHNTFNALATIFAFYLLFGGIFSIVSALLHRTDLWWGKLIVGAIQVLLAFWAAGNFGHKAFLLVVWIGASALAAGITQIVFALELRSGGRSEPPRPAFA
jgi:uncharacterized membrane protein HdeD (DUF308 family)